MTTVYVVSTARFIRGVLDLLGRGWLIERVVMYAPERFMIETREAR